MKTFRYLLEAIAIILAIGIFKLIPADKASAIGGAIARWIGPKLKVHHTAKKNLEMILPTSDHETILKGMWDNLGRTAIEFIYMPKLQGKAFDKRVTIHNQDLFMSLLDEHKNQHRRIIFFSGHFANWEICPKSSAHLGLPLALMYRRANNPYVDKLIQNARKTYQVEAISKSNSGLKQLIKSVKSNIPVGILMDQKANEGISVPFMGKPAMTAPAIATLALKYNCLLVPVEVVRNPDQFSFTVTPYPPLEYTTSGDIEADTLSILTQINHQLEEWVTKHPQQWFWVHKRWNI